MSRRVVCRASLLLLGLSLMAAAWRPAPARAQAPPSSRYEDLVQLFNDWRVFETPRRSNGVPDYTARAMATQHAELATYQRRLAAINPSRWPVAQQVDYRLVRAEMNGLDFDHRVRQPWARDPAFYTVIHAAQSDVPAHEGPSMHGGIEIWTYEFPVAGARLTDLQTRLRAVPAILEQARHNLVGDARDLWVASIRSVREQSATLAALADRLALTQPGLVADVKSARRAVDGFAAWLEAEAPKKQGPSGVGVEHYTWYLKNVHLLPYTWQDQLVMVRRELARSLAALALEEHRNRALPPLAPVASEDEYTRRFNEAVSEYIAFLRDREVLSVAPYMDAALRARIGRFRPSHGPREFFAEVDYRDPVIMRTHGFHWMDLARMAEDPHPSAIRRVPGLYNLWDGRAEGLATGMEEMMMNVGLFDARPRARELIYVLLAQRAARAMGDLMMHANRWTLEEAASYATSWTPRGWLRLDGETVWAEQHLYLQQPTYGTSYVIGKIEIEQLIADVARQRGHRFTLKSFMDDVQASGVIPVSLIRWEMTGLDDEWATRREDR